MINTQLFGGGPRRLLILTCALFATSAHAVDNETGLWAIFSTTDSITADGETTRWRYWLDAQARYTNFGSGANQYLVRPGIGYTLNPRTSLWLGYARFRTRNEAGNVSDENRIWQQLSWVAGRWQGGTISTRVRLLQRSLSTGNDLGIVLRLQAKYARPMGNGRTFVASVEPFFDLRDTDWGGSARLSQNRIFLGVGWQQTERLSFEVGYLNQFLFRDNGADRSNHLGTANFRAKF